MRRTIALLLCGSLICSLFAGCAGNNNGMEAPQVEINYSDESIVSEQMVTESTTEQSEILEERIKFTGPSDPNLLPYIENSIYSELDDELNGTAFAVSDVHAEYVSKEYLEDVSFNSLPNSFFGYSLANLDEAFENTKYVFTLGKEGGTEVKPLEIIEPADTERILEYAAVGAVCVIGIGITILVINGTIPVEAVELFFFIGGNTAKALAEEGNKLALTSAQITESLDWELVGDVMLTAGSLLEIIASAKNEEVNVGAIIGFLESACETADDLTDR